MTMRNVCIAVLFLASCLSAAAQTVWLDELDLSAMECGWGTPEAKKSVEGHTLKIAGHTFDRGVGTHAVSTFLLNLDGKGKRFTASVGVDDEVTSDKSSIEFFLVGDKKVLWSSGVMRKKETPKDLDVDLAGVKLLGLLVTDAGDGIDYDHADWADARLELTAAPSLSDLVQRNEEAPYILTPPSPETPAIHGAKVFGVRPGHPFLFTISATGTKPMTFAADRLPEGILLDPASGRITGSLSTAGTYPVTLHAKNSLGEASRDLSIVVGDKICLTPPMGWNSWNSWACAVTDEKVRAAADAMVSAGLADHGWTYINIDDCWEIKPDAKDPQLQGTPRTPSGMINTNKKFPDMKALSDYVHSKGLKLGIYSSPGTLTCAGFTASYKNESRDAEQYADWGIDYLKYDWCSYESVAKDRSIGELKKPYLVMRAALDKVPRDIVFSLCQYGMGNVWEWGADVGGNCWRTTGDISDSWSSMSTIGFGQAGHDKYAGPGHWNDPDMLVVGQVGWGPQLHPTRLTPDEQYTHITLWCLLTAPLLIGCDLSTMDAFTRNLLTNDEVIEVDQDPLGRQAHPVSDEGGAQIWAKDMLDGSVAVGLFYSGGGKLSPAEYFRWGDKPAMTIVLRGSDIGIQGKFSVRDLWRQKDLGVFDGQFETTVPFHGVALLRVAQTQ